MKNILLMLIFVLFIPWFAFAEETDCPFGFVNDPAPGSCARYIDTNNNDICDLSEVPTATNDISIEAKKDFTYLSEEELKSKISPRYRFLPITIVLLFCYLLTYILVLQKKMKMLTMRRIWNSVLLLSFLVSAILGLFLIIRINWGIVVTLPFNMLYWHVETGTVMAVVTLFHVSWYWRFYVCMLKRKKKEECKNTVC